MIFLEIGFIAVALGAGYVLGWRNGYNALERIRQNIERHK
jgi:hypothetical protein